MKIGILGGTFNPPHIGHIVLAKEIYEKLGLDKILLIPTNVPPHKENGGVEADTRLKMLELAVGDNKTFEVSDIELKRGGVSYTIDTVKKLKELYPQDELYLIVGSDLANDFSSWKDFDQLRKLVKIVVAQRDNAPLKDTEDFISVDITQIDTCSSDIRKLIKEGGLVKDLINKGVADYIEQHGLYR
jgi:nicotinate-nucleotide adenylyltransferase